MALRQESIHRREADLSENPGSALKVWIGDLDLAGIKLLEEGFAPADQIAGRFFDNFLRCIGSQGKQSRADLWATHVRRELSVVADDHPGASVHGRNQELQQGSLRGFIDDDHVEEAGRNREGGVLARLDGGVLEDALRCARGQGRAQEDDLAELLFPLLGIQEGPEGFFCRSFRGRMQAEEPLVFLMDDVLE